MWRSWPLRLGRQGVMVTSKGLGVLGDRITEADTKVIPIEDGFACFSDKIRLPLTPMVGVWRGSPRPGWISTVQCRGITALIWIRRW